MATIGNVSPSSSSKPLITEIGTEKTPLVQIDNFLDDTFPLLDALKKGPGFHKPKSLFPGFHAPMAIPHVQTIARHLLPMLTDLYDIPANSEPRVGLSFYGLTTLQTHELAPVLSLPHYDFYDDQIFVGLIYLNEGPYEGTGFYQHTSTGYERISAENHEEYGAIAASIEENLKDAEPTYNVQDDHYGEIGRVDYKPNRMAIYPANLLHAPLISKPELLTRDENKGRLTANIEIRFVNPN